MNTNSIRLLTTLLVAGLFALPIASLAQEGKSRDVDTLNTNARLKQMTTLLTLSDEQKEKIRPIILEEVKAVRQLREDGKTPLQERFAKEDELRATCRAKIKPHLTPEQIQKWDESAKKAPKKPAPKSQ